MTTARTSSNVGPKVPTFDIADRMVKARLTAEMDQQQLADAIGIHSRNTISNYETRITEPTVLLLRAVAAATDVDPDWLIGDYVKTPRRPRSRSALGVERLQATAEYLAPLLTLVPGEYAETAQTLDEIPVNSQLRLCQ